MNYQELIKIKATELLMIARAEGIHINISAHPHGALDVMCMKAGERVYDLERNDEGDWMELDHINYQLKKFK